MPLSSNTFANDLKVFFKIDRPKLHLVRKYVHLWKGTVFLELKLLENFMRISYVNSCTFSSSKNFSTKLFVG